MTKLMVKILAVLLILAALLVSPGWVKDLTVGTPAAPTTSVNYTVNGIGFENSNVIMYTSKLAAMKYDMLR